MMTILILQYWFESVFPSLDMIKTDIFQSFDYTYHVLLNLQVWLGCYVGSVREATKTISINMVSWPNGYSLSRFWELIACPVCPSCCGVSRREMLLLLPSTSTLWVFIETEKKDLRPGRLASCDCRLLQDCFILQDRRDPIRRLYGCSKALICNRDDRLSERDTLLSRTIAVASAWRDRHQQVSRLPDGHNQANPFPLPNAVCCREQMDAWPH